MGGSIDWYLFSSLSSSLLQCFSPSLHLGGCVAPTDPVVAGGAAASTLAVAVVPGRVRYTVAAGITLSSFSLLSHIFTVPCRILLQ